MMRWMNALVPALVLLAGCKTDGPLPSWAGGTGAAAATTTPTAAGGEGAAKPADEKPAEAKPAEAAASGDKIGVAECDQLVADYKACMDQLPEAQRGAMAQGYQQMVDGFKQVAASSPDAKSQLGAACKQAAAGMVDTFKSLGCSVTGASASSGEAAPSSGGSFGEAGGGALGKIGVPECDDFLGKYEKCVMSKFPEASRKQAIDAMVQTTASWKDLAKTDSGKQALVQGCKQADEQTKKAMSDFGCEW
jgi:uncharacterized protein YukE